ncbi:hypothetical protein M758_9G111600 [Ceratodon purpureus]|nr:hypothetical protein M758_9G111600 [Ceratodon purpureus]
MPAMDTTESLTQTESHPINMKEVSYKTTALDKERYEVACLRQDIIDEYEKKSRELLDYLNNMESEFKHQQREFEQREAILRHENKVLKDELSRGSKVAKRILLSKTRKYQVESQEIESALDMLKDETRQHEWNYRMEHKRAEELKAFVDDLQLELQRAEEVAVQRKKRMEQSKKRMERENQELRRKAALGWMLGCLSELYLRVDPKVGGAGIMKLVRKVQRELESGSSMFNEGDLPPQLEYETLQGELHRLLGSNWTTPLRNSAEPCNITKESTSRCVKSSNGDDQEESPRRRRKQWQKIYNVSDSDAIKAEDSKRPVTSPSIFEDISEDKSRKSSERSTWSEVHVKDNAQIASRECLKAETVGLLKGLEKSMSFLLSKEKRRAWC